MVKKTNNPITRRVLVFAVALMSVFALVVLARARLLRRTSDRPAKVLSEEQTGRRWAPSQIRSLTSVAIQSTRTKGPLSVPTFAMSGLQATLESASADKSAGKQRLTVSALNVGSEKIEALDLVLVDFTPQGTVSRVELRRLQLSLSPGEKGSASFFCELPHDPADAQTLAVTGVGHEAGRLDTDIRELIGALVVQRSRGLAPALAIAEKPKEQSTFTPDPCYDSLRLSHELAAKFGMAPNGNICNRYQHSFAIAFKPAPQA